MNREENVRRNPAAGGGSKLVMTVEKDGGAALSLKKIFRLCGRSCFCVVRNGDALPPCAEKSVLLLCRDGENFPSVFWKVCVAEQEISGHVPVCGRCLTYSLGRDDADFTAHGIRTLPDGYTAFEIVGIGVIGRVRLKPGSPSSIHDALASAAAAVGSGIPFADVLMALNREEISNGESENLQGMYNQKGSLQNKGGSGI